MIINFVYDLHPDICLSILFLQRITAKDALDAEYFWTDPLPCDPKRLDLPCTLVIYYVRCSLLLFVFCFVQKKKDGVETRVVITERARRTKSVSYLWFPLISDER